MKKRLLTLVLIAALFVGCSQQNKNTDVAFFYPKVEYTYNNEDGAISYEIRSSEDVPSSTHLLNLYLKGPEEDHLRNPFPENVSVLSIYILDDTVNVVLSDSMAELTGAPLILACACLGRTAIKLFGTGSAQIQCETRPLDGKKWIIINDSTVFYSDTFQRTEPEVS